MIDVLIPICIVLAIAAFGGVAWMVGHDGALRIPAHEHCWHLNFSPFLPEARICCLCTHHECVLAREVE